MLPPRSGFSRSASPRCLASFTALRAVLLPCLALLAGACSKAPPEVTVRTLEADEQSPRLDIASSDRFRAVAQMVGMAGGTPKKAAETGAPRLVWETPGGWKEEAASAMRDANFTFGDAGEGECYVSRLSGDGGGLEANVNRWRKQMGLAEATAEEISSLPRREVLGRDAVFVQLDGDYTAVGAAEPKKDQRMLGVIVIVDGGGLFVKLIGPRGLVEENTARFDALCESLDIQVQ